MRRAIAVSRQYFIRAVIISVLIIAALIFAARLAMPFAARRLIHSDPLVRADLIVVLGSYRLERALEAGSLFRERWSDRILLLRAPDIATSGLLRQLHLHIPVWLDIERDALVQMSVPPAMIIDASRALDSTLAEAEFVAEYARSHQYQRIIVVTSPYHTGRAFRLFRGAARGSFTVVMRPTRYESPDPDHWWRHAPDRTDVVLEYLKTLHGLVAR
ncbi:MAG: hypothetical protein DMF59_18445 [Acidobacteria bacterium]|nr:MAG: hypothetical protein DMF59_18445 [Acidobacteriota bacterium]